jgi:KAP family P-loop domain/Carboxypeptidase regulatory-like domain
MNPSTNKAEVQSENLRSDEYVGGSGFIEPGKRFSVRRVMYYFRRAANLLRGGVLSLLPFLARAPRTAMTAIALILLALAAWQEFGAAPLVWSDPAPYLAHWKTPRRLHGERMLPAFDQGNIESIEAVRGSQRIWIAGDGGLLAYSDDEGQQWTTFQYDATTGTVVRARIAESGPTVAALLTWRVEAAKAQAQQQQTQSQRQNPRANEQQQSQNSPSQEKPSPSKLSAAISGNVTDENGAQVSVADVTITETATGLRRSAKTDAGGTFTFADLPLGTYQLVAVHAGFKSSLVPEITLTTKGFFANVVLKASPGATTSAVTTNAKSVRQGSQEAANPAKSSSKNVNSWPQTRPNWIAVEFDTANTGRLVSADNYVLYTTDAGNSWSTTASPSPTLEHKGVKPGQRGSASALERVAAFILHTEPRVLVFVADDGKLHRSATSYPAPSAPVESVHARITAITGREPNDLWAAGSSEDQRSAEIYHSGDRGVSWSRVFSRAGLKLQGIVFREDGQTGFAAGSSGGILRTVDAGQHWQAVTLGAAAPGKLSTDYGWWQQPWRIPAPVSLVEMLLALILFIPVLVPEAVPRHIEQTIASVTVSDAPVISPVDDTLGFGPVARAISGLLRNKGTKLPITLAITAQWGRGKTSLMSLVQQDLKLAGWRTVWFNAWHHQEELSLLAALLQTVRQKAPPSLLERNGAHYRVKLLTARLMRWQTLWVAAACLVLYNSETAVHKRHPHMYGCAAQYLYKTSGGVLEGNESLCSQVISSTKTPAAEPSQPLFAAKGAKVANSTNEEQKSSGNSAGTAPTSAEKPGVVQFVMRLIFDAALKLESLEDSTLPGVHIIPFLVLLTLVLVLGWQILESFGANPAELLTPETARHNVSELEARTSFLEKFRKQYGEVVDALGKYRLAIFVDDLDRCRPEKISEMLEAANYLMAAGPCAMVMALEEEAVISGLGLSFSRMAEEFVKLPSVDLKSGDLLADARAKRQSFGRLYVEKLLNIVVQVPAINSEKFIHILSGSEGKQEKNRELRALRIRRIAEVARVPAAAIVLAAIILVGGNLISERLLGPERAEVASGKTPSGSVAGPVADTTAPSGTITPSASTAQVAQQGSNSKVVAQPIYVAAASPLPYRWFAGWWQWLAWLMLFVAFAAATLAKRPPPVTTDSTTFVQALKLWAPLLAQVNSSPRSAKRLLNRLRYLAMLEREAANGTKAAAIPEPMLVALGVLDTAMPTTMASESELNELLDLTADSGSSGDATWNVARDLLHKHEESFGAVKDRQFEEYRERFKDLSSGITAR